MMRRVPWRRRKPDADPNRLFDGDGSAFKNAVAGARVYGEYGMGKSTVWVLRNTGADVIAVETVPEWIDYVRERAGAAAKRLDAVHVDLGPTEGHGRPSSYANRAEFPRYTDALWIRDRCPDVVLIDGRFRVCCFLTSLRHADPGTLLFFDDYSDRPRYHIAEAFLKPTEIAGRQAVFEVPGRVDREVLDHAIERFRHVMDQALVIAVDPAVAGNFLTSGERRVRQ